MRQASWARYQAKSTVGVLAVARSQSIRTTPVAVEAQVVVAQVAVDQRGPVVRAGQCFGQPGGLEHQRQHRLAHVGRDDLRECLPGVLELLREQVAARSLGTRDGWGGHAEAVAQAGGPVGYAAVKGAMEGGGHLEDAPASFS